MKYFDKKICRVTFTHSDCSDVWNIYFGEMNKYFNNELKHYICIDNKRKDYSKFLPTKTKGVFLMRNINMMSM